MDTQNKLPDWLKRQSPEQAPKLLALLEAQAAIDGAWALELADELRDRLGLEPRLLGKWMAQDQPSDDREDA